MKTKLCFVLLVAFVGQEVASQRLLGLMASAGIMRALRNRDQQQKESPSPLNQHAPEPVAGAYPGSQQGYRPPVSAHSGYGYSGGFSGNSPVSSLEGASPFGAASYGYPSFSQFGSGSFGGGYPGSNVGFAPSSFQNFGSIQGAEQLAAASQQAYQTAPSSYGSAISTPYASKGYTGQGQNYQ